MIPFASARDQHGKVIQRRGDPFEQFAQALGLPPATISRLQLAKAINQQPGQIGVKLAIEIYQLMHQQYRAELQKNRKDLSTAIEDLAIKKKWHRTPFNGLTTQLQQQIRDHYRESNQKFCQTFWPNQTWEQLYPAAQIGEEPQGISKESINLTILCNNIIANTLPKQEISLPGA